MVKEADLLNKLQRKLKRMDRILKKGADSDSDDDDSKDNKYKKSAQVTSVEVGTVFNNGWRKCPWMKRGGAVCGKKTKREYCAAHIKLGPKPDQVTAST